MGDLKKAKGRLGTKETAEVGKSLKTANNMNLLNADVTVSENGAGSRESVIVTADCRGGMGPGGMGPRGDSETAPDLATQAATSMVAPTEHSSDDDEPARDPLDASPPQPRMTRSRSLEIRNRDRATPSTPINYDTEPIPRDIFGPLNTDDPSLKDLMTAIMVSHNKTSVSLNKIDNRFIEFEKSLEFTNAKVMENVQSIDSLRTENRELKSICNSLSSELTLLKQEVKQLKSKQDATEWRSREWGIRVYGVPEVPREDTRAVLLNLIAQHHLAGLNTAMKASSAIEHCHRLGHVQPGKHRPIIANLYSRPLRNALLKSAKEVNNDPSSPIYFAEDMTKDDHELKLKARAQMKAAHDAGRRVCFRRGKLIIDSRVTTIEGANGSGGSVHENVDVA